MWRWGSIPIPIAITVGPPLLKGQVPLGAVLVFPHLSGLHLMDGGHLSCFGHKPVAVKPPLRKPFDKVVIGPVVHVVQCGRSGQQCWLLWRSGTWWL